jgi:hypothetical protein
MIGTLKGDEDKALEGGFRMRRAARTSRQAPGGTLPTWPGLSSAETS